MQSSGTSKNQGLLFIYKIEKSLVYISFSLADVCLGGARGRCMG